MTPWTSRSPPTRSCCATPPASCSRASAHPRSYARTSTIPMRISRCGNTYATTPRSDTDRRPISACSSTRQASRLRPDPSSRPAALFAPLTGEDASGSAAVAGADGRWVPNDEPVKTFVLEADRVDRIAIVGTGPALAVIDRPPPERLRFVATVDFSRRVFEVDTTGLALDWKPVVLEPWFARASVALAAEMVGTARRIFTMTLEYAKEREQFDVPIGSFQAIQHKLAEMSLALERAVAAVQYAAMTRRRREPGCDRRCPCRAGRRGRGVPAHPEGRHPDPRRHRLHVGARPAPVSAPRHRRRVPPGLHRLAPRPDRRLAFLSRDERPGHLAFGRERDVEQQRRRRGGGRAPACPTGSPSTSPAGIDTAGLP